MFATSTNSSLFSSSERHFNPCKNACFVQIQTLNGELLIDGTACLQLLCQKQKLSCITSEVTINYKPKYVAVYETLIFA